MTLYILCYDGYDTWDYTSKPWFKLRIPGVTYNKLEIVL